jgi:outer membrane protein TolC
MDPQPGELTNMAAPVNPPPGQTRAEFRASEAASSELATVLVPSLSEFDEAQAGGLPRKSTPYVLTMDQAFTLALLNSRIYQFQLEQVFGAALAVTLQRFSFMPQFYAGLSPQTGVPFPGGSFPGLVPANSFLYSTRETGAQQSTLNIGTVAGYGKLFDTGARLLAGFANQVVFNFIGKNSVQPSVRSILPLSLIQPFLRGGGRAVTLENLTAAERGMIYTIRSFAKFRQEFTVQILVGGTITNFGSAVPSVGFSGVQSNDPNVGYLNVVEDIQLLENQRRNIAAYERILEVYKELAKGESSGISQLQVDQIDQQLQGARSNFINQRIQYRFDLDQFKQQMGLPPDTPIIPDRNITRRFKETFEAVDDWQRNPRRRLEELPRFVESLPQLEDIIIDGRSVLGVYREGKNDEDELEDLLRAGERVAMERRLDLMNQRATLYDTWRQIKFTANALQGILNVTLTNQFVTPSTTNNPFSFVEQAKQFSLVLNAELPLVRLSERNNFRQALINYQRQRRSLQNTEDSIKNIVRQDIRVVQQFYLNYEIAKKNFILSIRLKDQAFEQIVAPPAAAGSQAALQTTNLVGFQNSLIQQENNLITGWYQYQVNRLELYRDLGTLPLDEWEAFNELFPAEPVGTLTDTASRNAGPSRVATTRAPATVEAARR